MHYLIDFSSDNYVTFNSKPRKSLRKIRKDKYSKRKASIDKARQERIEKEHEFKRRQELRKSLNEGSREARGWLSLGSRLIRYAT